jgi:hypothetical protein
MPLQIAKKISSNNQSNETMIALKGTDWHWLLIGVIAVT